MPAPVIISDFCNKKCDYQKKITGTSDFDGEIFLVAQDNPTVVVATGIALAGVWEVSSSDLTDTAYIAKGIRHDGIIGGTITVNTGLTCDADCIVVGAVNGTTTDIPTGIISAYLSPYVDGNIPVANAVIENNVFSIKSVALQSGVPYVFYALKLEIT